MYGAEVARWLAFGGDAGSIDRIDLLAYLAQRRERCSPATVNMGIKALRAFYRAGALLGWCPADTDAQIPAQRRIPARAVRWLEPDQVGQVFGTCALDTFTGLRDYSMLRVLYETGLRASELAALTTSSEVDGCLFVDGGKGGHDRWQPISGDLSRWLAGYRHARAQLRPGKRLALWLTQHGKPLAGGRAVWRIVSERIWRGVGAEQGWFRLRGTGKPWTGHYPHELRASFATALLRGGLDVFRVAQLLGHADVSTTALYLGVEIDQLREAIRRHPRASRR